MNRDFHADKPNQKWVTDISYIHTAQGVLYLSAIRDLYDNSIVAYQTGTEQTINLVLSTIRKARQVQQARKAPLVGQLAILDSRYVHNGRKYDNNAD